MTTTDSRTDHFSGDPHRRTVGAAPTPSDDRPRDDAQEHLVAAGPLLRIDPTTSDAQSPRVGAAYSPSDDHGCSDTRSSDVVAGPEQAISTSAPKRRTPVRDPHSSIDQQNIDTHHADVDGGPTSPAAIGESTPRHRVPPGTSDSGHAPLDTHSGSAVVAFNSVVDQMRSDTQNHGVDGGPSAAIPPPVPPDVVPLVDKPLAVIAELLNDLEDLRKANVNRLEVMTRAGFDKDGENRGWGLLETHPAVVSIKSMVDALQKVEDKAKNDLEKALKSSPLGPWVVAQHGLGLKTVARLLASIGDPYWNDLHERPRTVSELWAYTGYRPGLKRIKGEKVNWSPTAKMRMHNIIEPIKKMIKAPCYSEKDEKGAYVRAVHVEGECVCSPYRVLWDQAREKYAGTVHPEDCVRCGPAGKPALAGSVRSAAHQQAMADRLVKKEILKDLWREAKRLHELPGDHIRSDTQCCPVAGGPN